MTPVYAMANGVVVAARFALSSDPASTGFLLIRHELFHQTVANHRIDYDLGPTFIWSHGALRGAMEAQHVSQRGGPCFRDREDEIRPCTERDRPRGWDCEGAARAPPTGRLTGACRHTGDRAGNPAGVGFGQLRGRPFLRSVAHWAVLQFGASSCAFVIAPGDADSFLASFLPSDGLSARLISASSGRAEGASRSGERQAWMQRCRSACQLADFRSLTSTLVYEQPILKSQPRFQVLWG